MEFYKNNAHSELFLHDCECKMVYDNEKQTLQFIFEVGFLLSDDGKGNIVRKPGIIQISNLPLDEIDIKIFKYRNLFGKFRMIGKYCELADFNKFFENYYFQVIDDYYSYGTLLLKCVPYPYNKKYNFNEIQIQIYHGESPLEYYFI